MERNGVCDTIFVLEAAAGNNLPTENLNKDIKVENRSLWYGFLIFFYATVRN